MINHLDRFFQINFIRFVCFFSRSSAAVAYHLAIQGLGHEVVLLEQDRFV